VAAINRLTARAVETKRNRGHYADGGGLVLQISKWGTKSWIFRYQRDGRERHMGIGPVHTLSLIEARERARECRRLLLDGRDPIDERTAERRRRQIEAARAMTFTQCAEAYIAAHQAGWTNRKHRTQWSSSVEAYAFPVMGDLPVAAIDTALVMKCLEPMWKAKPETAKRVRGRIEAVLDWAAVRGFRSSENPARWRGHLDKLLPAPGKVRATSHFPAIAWTDLAAFMADLRACEPISARALEFTILTAARTGEAVAARWSEFDLAAKTWTIPAARMKAKRDHRVPLSPRVLEILSDIPRHSEKVFDLGNSALLNALKRMGRADLTVHGFRSTFRDWAAETTAYPNHVVEMALAHLVSDKVEAAYRRGDLLEKRRRLMEEWARYCGRPSAAHSDAKVTSLRGAM
jgi:integrase